MNFITTLLEQYNLMESLDSIIKANPNIPEQTIRDYHQHALPDGNKSDRVLNHVLKMHRNGEITTDRAAELKPHLTALHLSNQLNKISSLKTLDDHKNATVGMNTTTKKERIDKDTPVLPSPDNLIVRQHLNHESAVKGAMMHPENPMYTNTREHGKAQWCLSVGGEDGLQHFNEYTKKGNHPLYTIHNKDTKRVSALVADPSKWVDDDYYDKKPTINYGQFDSRNVVHEDLEIRDEKDKLQSPYHLLVNNPGLEHTVVGDFFKEHHPNSIKLLEKVPHDASSKYINTVLSQHNSKINTELLVHPNIDEGHLTTILNDPRNSIETRVAALGHHKITEDHIMTALRHKNPEMQYAALVSPKLPDGVLKNILNNGSPMMKSAALFNPKVTKDQITDILQKETNPDLLEVAIAHKNAQKEHFDKVLSMIQPMYKRVRRAVIYNPNSDEDHITTSLDDPDDYVRAGALSHHKVNEDHITKALDDPEPWVVHKAILHPKATRAHLIKATSHEDEGVSIEATEKLEKLNHNG